jgi:hypothetical protein
MMNAMAMAVNQAVTGTVARNLVIPDDSQVNELSRHKESTAALAAGAISHKEHQKQSAQSGLEVASQLTA